MYYLKPNRKRRKEDTDAKVKYCRCRNAPL